MTDENPPPAGGFGQPQPFQHTKVGFRPARKPSRSGALIVGGLVLGVLAVLFAIGARKYFRGVPLRPGAEAMNAVGQIGKDLSRAYEDTGVLCPSSRAVPGDDAFIRGKKYQSRLAEWQGDPGWACAKFEMSSPQSYQYWFETKGNDVTIVAEGDLNGDGVISKFELHGHAEPDHAGGRRLVLEPHIRMTNPDE